MSNRVEVKFPENFNDLKRSLSSIIGMALLLLLVWAGFTSVYTVPAESKAVILRLGNYQTTASAGLHFRLPFGIDRKFVIPVERQLAQEFGFSGSSQTRRSQGQDLERNMVTGDKNAVTVEWIVQYKISDPKDYLFNVRDPEDTLHDIAESVMRTVVGDRTVDEVITIGRQEIANKAEILMQRLVDTYELGLGIDQVQLNDVNPPGPVQPSFNEVNQAQQERERLINVATGEYNKVIPRSRGLADQSIQAAEGYALKRVNEAQGDVSRFNALFEAYMKAPEVTKRRMYLETMQVVVPKLGKKIVIDSDANQILPFMQLGAK